MHVASVEEKEEELSCFEGVPNMMSVLIPSANTGKCGAAGWTRAD